MNALYRARPLAIVHAKSRLSSYAVRGLIGVPWGFSGAGDCGLHALIRWPTRIDRVSVAAWALLWRMSEKGRAHAALGLPARRLACLLGVLLVLILGAAGTSLGADLAGSDIRFAGSLDVVVADTCRKPYVGE